jgi:hypothetical protein
MTTPGATPAQFAVTLLTALGAPTTPANVNSIVNWAQREGGHWNNTAHYNPLNTTLRLPGSQVMGGGNSAGVQSYQNWQQGVQATVNTLRNGGYQDILQALHSGNGLTGHLAGLSRWSGGGYSSLSGSGNAPTGQGLPTGVAGPATNLTSAYQNALSAQQAARESQVLGLVKQGLKGSESLGEGPTSPGLGNLPDSLLNMISAAQNSLQKIAGSTVLNPHPALAAAHQQAGSQPYSGYVNPFPGASIGRTDQGVDVSMKPGDPIRAIGNARVIGVIPNWFQGQPLVYYQLLDGPKAGQYVYVAEQINNIAKPGTVLRAGEPVATYAGSGTGVETGWATSSGQTKARATTGYSEGQQTPAGQQFRDFLGGL